MKRSKKHEIKVEPPETSTSRQAKQKDHDLTFYIHDRVELMHQVFSVLKHKELRAMAPNSVRNISVDDLQELCMEELLGISSKRLCAILDGANPPSDTESSSESEQLETISLDSISSDEEILCQESAKKSKKHKHRSKTKPKKRKCKDNHDEEREQADKSRRAGLTVLELLELQARARAIRAQLQKEKTSAEQPTQLVTGNSSDDEIEIKEEAAEVVEISSEDEKPNIRELEERTAASRKETASDASSNSNFVTKKVNDLVITVPKVSTSRKIKLKRNTSSNSNAAEISSEKDKKVTKVRCSNNVAVVKTSNANAKKTGTLGRTQIVFSKPEVAPKAAESSQYMEQIKNTDKVIPTTKGKTKSRDKKKKRRKDIQNDNDGSDHDEIMLQLSDTEKMDLLEDLEGQKPENCSDTEDSSIDSSDESSAERVYVISEEIKHQKADDSQSSAIDSDIVTEIKENVEVLESNSNSNNTERISNQKQTVEVESCAHETKPDLEPPANIDEIIVKNKDIANKNVGDHLSNIKKSNLVISIVEGTETSIEGRLLNSDDNFIKHDCKERENGVPDEIDVEMINLNDMPLKTLEVDTPSILKEGVQDTENINKQKVPDVEGLSKEVAHEINDNTLSTNGNELNSTDKEQPQQEHIESELLPNSSNIVGQSKKVEEVMDVYDLSKDGSVAINTIENLPLHQENNKIDSSSNSELHLTENTSKNEHILVNIESFNEKSEGELSDRDSSEVEASNIKPDVVCISDEEEQNRKKKKKKVKKSKKHKKSKKKDFRESGDQNHYTESNENVNKVDSTKLNESSVKYDNMVKENNKGEELIMSSENEVNEGKRLEFTEEDNVQIINMNDDGYEILELSDDSSCYEIEDISISKEPTAEEMEALSTKLDQIETPVDDDSQDSKGSEVEDVDQMSWRDRYLKSSKVKQVLITSSVMNAMRKKNLELKRKLQESKTEIENENEKREVENVETANYEEGSIEQYKTLETRNKYVDPAKEMTDATDEETEMKEETRNNEKDKVSNDMKKDAKQLLKMYRRLLKYNDMAIQKDPNKKHKKRKKKSKDKDENVTGREA